MGEITFRAVTTYKDTATLDAEGLKAALCAGVNTPECKEAVDRYIGVDSKQYILNSGTEEWTRGGETNAHRKTTSSAKLVAYDHVVADFDGDGKMDRLNVTASSVNGTSWVLMAIASHYINIPDIPWTLLFTDKSPVRLALPDEIVHLHVPEAVSGDARQTFASALAFIASSPALHSGVPHIEKLVVEDLNGDTIPDLEIETGRKVDGRHEFIQFLSRSPAATLAPHRKALAIITGATDDTALLTKLGALETLATQTGRTLEATIRAKLVKALVATYRAELELITGSPDEAVLKAKAEHLVTLAEQTGRGIVDVIRAKAEKARQPSRMGVRYGRDRKLQNECPPEA